jgi:hypothetical protein
MPMHIRHPAHVQPQRRAAPRPQRVWPLLPGAARKQLAQQVARVLGRVRSEEMRHAERIE